MSRSTILPLVVVGILGLMVLPIPSVMLDYLLAINITVSLAVMLTAMHIIRPLEFSAFPSLLLVTTLFRLGLNVCSTRLILLNGHEGIGAAGRVIETFGNFVAGGNYVVGLVIFLILIIINFAVITKGSGRIAEVAARFTLDALPGKQMSIDSDLASGIITQEHARNKRERLAMEADFYGAMDGANKFVRGDAIAGLIITGINIVGGLIIGMTQGGLSVGEAAAIYTILTIGDGLVSQIPALVISTSAGLVVTRATDGKNLSDQILGQTFGNPKVLGGASAVAGALALVPGLPLLPFMGLSVALYVLKRVTPEPKDPYDDEPGEEDDAPLTEEEELQELLPVEPLQLQVGFSLVPLVDREKGGELLDRIVGLRKRFAKELGIVLPAVHLRDSLDIGGGEYEVYIHSVCVGSGQVMVDRLLAIDPGDTVEPIEGTPTTDPAFGIPALWIDSADQEKAEMAGYTVVEPAAVIATHLSEIFRDKASDIIGRQELQDLVDVVARRHPKIVDELIPSVLSYSEVLAVVRGLLVEKVSIRDMRTILESMADAARVSKNPIFLAEQVRQRLGPAITQGLTESDGVLYAALLDPGCEEELRGCLLKTENDISLAPDLSTAQALLAGLQNAVEQLGLAGRRPIIVAPSDLRFALWKFAHRFMAQVIVMSQQELPPRQEVSSVASVSLLRGQLDPGSPTPVGGAPIGQESHV